MTSVLLGPSITFHLGALCKSISQPRSVPYPRVSLLPQRLRFQRRSPRFAFVTNTNDNTISIYTVNATSGLLRNDGYALVGSKPEGVTVTPNGKFLYVTNSGSSNVSCIFSELAKRWSHRGNRFPIRGEIWAIGCRHRSIRKISVGYKQDLWKHFCIHDQ